MNEENIKRFAESISGAYPAKNMFVKNMVAAYSRETFIEHMTTKEASDLFDIIVKECDEPPSLGQIRALYYRHIVKEPAKPICDQCDNTGWIMPLNDDGSRKTRSNGLHDMQGNLLEYTYVVRCVCREVK
jgi:hypothetical protein